MAKGKSPKRKATTRAKRAGAARRGAPGLGSKVHYAGYVWTITAFENDPNNVGKFVDLVREDDATITARVHSANLAEDTTGGYTWQESRPLPGSKHAGDPRFPLSEEHRDRHERFARIVDRLAQAIFERSRWSDDRSWDTLTEEQRQRLRRLVRALLLNLPVPTVPPGLTLTQILTYIFANLPADIKEWLAANPQ